MPINLMSEKNIDIVFMDCRFESIYTCFYIEIFCKEDCYFNVDDIEISNFNNITSKSDIKSNKIESNNLKSGDRLNGYLILEPTNVCTNKYQIKYKDEYMMIRR